MLYTTFRGNEATRYGASLRMEDTTRQDYLAYQRERGHLKLTIAKVGLVVSLDTPWSAGSPDDRVTDPDDPLPLGLVEYKNPFVHDNSQFLRPVTCQYSVYKRKNDMTTTIKYNANFTVTTRIGVTLLYELKRSYMLRGFTVT